MTPPTVRLEVVAGRAIGMWILIDDELLIGRHADGAGRLADDEEISRSHARISLDRSHFCAIEDLGSTNGTFVNGLRIARPQTLSVGDTVEVGGTTLVVRELPVPEASERPLKAVPPQPTLAPEPGTGTGKPSTASSQETPATASQRSARVTPSAADKGSTNAAAPGRLSLTLNLDAGAREATVSVDAASEPLRLVFDGGAWRPAPSGPGPEEPQAPSGGASSR